MSYTIYISTFNKKVLRIKGGIPIEVGAAIRSNFIYELYDNTGNNISYENKYYGELTGLYWIWKNVNIADDDIIGFCHYNKALHISKHKACSWLKNNKNGMITLKPCKIRNHSFFFFFQAIMAILHKKGQDLYTTWNKLYDNEAAARKESCRGGNMFITTGAVFRDYCTWLFDILSEMRKIVGDRPNADANMRRYCAFMGERLLSVYIEYNRLPVKGVNVRYKEWWLSSTRFVINKLNVNKDSRLYSFLKQKFGYKSLYNR